MKSESKGVKVLGRVSVNSKLFTFFLFFALAAILFIVAESFYLFWLTVT